MQTVSTMFVLHSQSLELGVLFILCDLFYDIYYFMTILFDAILTFFVFTGGHFGI